MTQFDVQRTIPAIMATQHPDNAHAPYWETDGDGFVSVHEESKECVSAFQDLHVQEFMWDWEGKHADAAVIDKLFTEYHEYFKEHQIGKEIFLTFRIPNIWHEKGYSLLRALSVILTSEDFAKDLNFHTPPLFEVILPMTESADQLVHIQNAYKKFAQFKQDVLDQQQYTNQEYLRIIPLVEGIESQLEIGTLLRDYIVKHTQLFNRPPTYIRPFLAASDPALVGGVVATVLANKIALSEIAKVSKETGIPMYPIIGVGSLPFRGGLNPENVDRFIKEYKGVRTVTVQSAFRYDYPKEQVEAAIQKLKRELPYTDTIIISDEEKNTLINIIHKFKTHYQFTLDKILPELEPFFSLVPKRRERKLHIGLLGYGRNMGKNTLPRAICFTGACYSLGIPPELIGSGQALATLTEPEFQLLKKHYISFEQNMLEAGRYLNKETVNTYIETNKAWQFIARDIHDLEHHVHITLGPQTPAEHIHHNLSANMLLAKGDNTYRQELIIKTGKIRKSLG